MGRRNILDYASDGFRGAVRGVSATGTVSFSQSMAAGATYSQTIALSKGGFKQGMMVIASGSSGAGGGYAGGTIIVFDATAANTISMDNPPGLYANFYVKFASSTVLSGTMYGGASSNTVEITACSLNTAGDTITITWHNTAATTKTAGAYERWHVWQ